MCGLVESRGVVDLGRGPKSDSGKASVCARAVARLALPAAICLWMLLPTQPVSAGAEQTGFINVHKGLNPHQSFDDPELSALQAYARQAGIEEPKEASTSKSKKPHPHFDDP